MQPTACHDPCWLGTLTGVEDVSGQDPQLVAVASSPARHEARSSSASAATACHLDAAYAPSPSAGGEGSSQEATSAADPVRASILPLISPRNVACRRHVVSITSRNCCSAVDW